MNEPLDAPSENLWQPIFQCAVEFHSTGRLNEAGSLFAAIVENNPTHFPSLQRLAAIRRQQGRLEESLALLERAVASNPNSADAHNSLGNTLNSLGRHEEALNRYRCAAALRQNFPEAHFNLGRSLNGLGRFEEAAAAYRAAIALRPEYAEAHINLGTVLSRLNRPDEALSSFSAALSTHPHIKTAHNNIGLALTALNRHEKALAFFERARELEPGAPQPVFNESMVHLALGDYERGWRGYEARWHVPELKLQPREFVQPQWDGESALEGKTILVHSEQGLGDTILFARFVEPLLARGARVVLQVQKPLARLMRSIPGVAQVVTAGDSLPDFDFHAPFGSLPLALKTTLETVPARMPYLKAPGESETIAGLEVLNDSRPLVGVCWAGNPDYPNDHNRSIPLGVFKRLFEVPGLRFVSLQQNFRPGDETTVGGFGNLELTSIGKANDLADTAALLSRLDMVVTVDTAIAHLAGALNCPLLILLPYYAHWVWLRQGAGSRWYPSARLLRQTQIGDWRIVIERVAAEAFIQAPRARTG